MMSPNRPSPGTRINRRAALRGALATGAAIATGGFAYQSVAAAQATPETSGGIPDTALGREFASLLAAVNSREPDRLLAHFEGYFPAEMVEGMAASTYLNTIPMGTLAVHRIDDASETSLTALVETTLSEEWLSITLASGEEGSDINVRPAEPLAGVLPDEPLDDTALADELTRYLGKLADAGVFSGAVLIARDGEPIFAEAYGLANVERGEPNQVGTRFNLGSMNKMFTATAIARLVESGDVAFTDPIATHLPDYPADVANTVTIHHLLTHTSGLGDIFGPRYDAERESLHTLDDYLRLFMDEPLRFEPGARHEYSNAGFIVLGLIIEAVTGQDYFDHVREQVYAVAGMDATDAFERDARTPDLATGYTYRLPEDMADLTFEDVLAGPVPNDFFLAPRGTSAGGGYSTVEDLLRFDQGLRSGAFVAPAMVETLIEGKVDTPRPETRYAYGFVDDRSGSERVVGHSGGAPGINGNLDMYWDADVTVAVLANVDRMVQLVSMRARRMLFGAATTATQGRSLLAVR
jgi:CubicO group peptidase (beta-lactamase class C family)